MSVDLALSALKNAGVYYSSKKKAGAKEARTAESHAKAMAAVCTPPVIHDRPK